jgi:Zn-dependent alcohol dehydrogenase
MRGIVFNGTRAELRDDCSVRAPETGEVWVRMVAAGVCHSDLSVLDGTIAWPAPSMMGHEGAGTVEAVGPNVHTVAVGDPVVVSTVANCGVCRWCNIGKPTWCRGSIGNRTEPFTVGGEPCGNFAAASSFAEVTVVKEIQAVKIPSGVPLTSACLIACGVVTGVGSVFNRANVQPGQTAAVFGAGGVGLSVIQGLRLKSASRIVAVDTMASKEAMARQMGATDFVNAADLDAVEAVRELLPHAPGVVRGPFGAGGVDWAFECVGVPAVLSSALDVLDWGGMCVSVGQPAFGATAPVPITFLNQVDRGIIGSRAGGVRPQYDIPMIADLYQRGLLDLDSMVSKIYRLDAFDAVVQDMHDGKLARGVLTFR